MRIVLVIILMTGTLRAPGFAFFQKAADSLDQYINTQIEQVYEGAYYREPDSVSEKFDGLKSMAGKEGRYHMSLYLLAVEAQCMAFHNRFERMRTLIVNAKELIGNYERNIARLDTTYDARNTVDFTEGLYFYSVGDYHRSIKCFDALLEKDKIRQTLGADYLFSIHSYLGSCYQRLLLYDKAYLHYSKAMEAAKLSNYSDYNTALIHTYLGNAKAGMANYGDGDQDDLEQAEDHYTQALQFFLKYKDDASYSNAIAATYSQLSLLNVTRGNFATAIKQLKKTSEYSAPDDPDMVITYMDYGDLYKKMGETELAKKYYQHSSTLSKQLYKEKHVRKSYSLFALAELSIQSNLYDSALYLCQEGLSQVTHQVAGDTIVNHLQVLEGLKIKGLALAGKYSQLKQEDKYLNAAIESYLSALAVIDEINKKLPYTEYKKHFKAHLQDFYESAMEMVYMAASEEHGQRDYVELLWDLMESNKNTMLTEALNNTMALQYAGIPSKLIEKEINLKTKAAELRRNLSMEYDHIDTARWRNDLYEVTNRLDSLVKSFETEYPRYYDLKYNNNRYSLSEVKKHLKSNEILLEYFWGENEVYCMGVSSNKTVIKKIELNSEIDETFTSLITF
ncbi:tetratricopeptide repeat protein, partial [Fulvivirga kasyanovii]